MLWAGTDDGNLQMSRDGGKTWTNVLSHMQGVPKGGVRQPHRGVVQGGGHGLRHRSTIIAAPTTASTFTDQELRRFVDEDHQRHPAGAGTVHVIREDPVNPNLLFAGTEFGLYVSFDRGATGTG